MVVGYVSCKCFMSEKRIQIQNETNSKNERANERNKKKKTNGNVHLRIPHIMEQAGGHAVAANDDCLLYECLRYANTFRFK